jgi:putative membrane protein
MTRFALKAVFIVTLLVATILSFNLLVGAQEKQQAGDTKAKQTTKQKADNSSQQDPAMASTAGDTSTTLSSSDRKFVMEAAHGGMMEVELGRLAAQKGASDDVKQFGQRMLDDHSKANDELMQLAKTKGITLPAPGDHAMMSAAQQEGGKENRSAAEKNHHEMMMKHQKVMAKLTYMEMMVKDHTKAVAAFEKEAAKGGDADLKRWASEKLPTLRDHLQQARAIEAAVKGKTSAKTSK